MIRRPPRSTLFPYTRSSDLRCGGCPGGRSRPERCLEWRVRVWPRRPARRPPRGGRSEEDTSEIQSTCKIVLRLLLVKKKKKRKSYQTLSDDVRRTNNSRLAH